MTHLNLDSLQMFTDLVETGSFSRTAEKNFVSQSAVSQRIRTLEQEFGESLLERGQGRGKVTPTAAGDTLYRGAKPLLQNAALLDSQMRQLSDEIAGTVRVATVYSVGLHALPPRLKPFLAVHPRINIHLEYEQTEKVYENVASGVVDVGIVACPSPRRGLEIVPFAEEPMVVIMAPEHPLAVHAMLSLKQLDSEPFIAFAEHIPTRRLVDEHLRAANTRVKIIATFDNIETIKNLVEIGSGVSILPADTVRQEDREGMLVVRQLQAKEAFKRPTGLLVRSKQTHRAAINAFVEAMRQKSPI